MKEVTLKFYSPDEKLPKEARIMGKHRNVKDKLIIAITADGQPNAACYTDQGDGVYSIKGRMNKRPLQNVILWADIPEVVL